MADTRLELYRAVKHLVHEYQAEVGYSLRELWNIVSDPTAKDHDFWRMTAISTYHEDIRK